MFQPICNHRCVNAKTVRPIGDAKGFAVCGEKAVVAFISALLVFCCPTAICRTVALVVVFAFNAVLCRRPMSHICKEFSEVVPPFFADSDAPSTVPVVVKSVGVVASLDHHVPDSPLGCFACAMRGSIFLYPLALITAAGDAFAVPQALRQDGSSCSALTLAQPSPPIVCRAQIAKNCPSSEFTVWYDLFGHGIFSHTESVVARLVQGLTALFEPLCIIT